MGAKRRRVDGRKSHAGKKQKTKQGERSVLIRLQAWIHFWLSHIVFEIPISAYFTLWNTDFHFLQIQGMALSKGFVSVCQFLFCCSCCMFFFLLRQGGKLMKPGKIPQHQVQWNVPLGQAIYISYTDDDDFSLAGKDILGQRIKPKVETEVAKKKEVRFRSRGILLGD